MRRIYPTVDFADKERRHFHFYSNHWSDGSVKGGTSALSRHKAIPCI